MAKAPSGKMDVKREARTRVPRPMAVADLVVDIGQTHGSPAVAVDVHATKDPGGSDHPVVAHATAASPSERGPRC